MATNAETLTGLYASVGKKGALIDKQGWDYWTARQAAGEDITKAFRDATGTVYDNTLKGVPSQYKDQNAQGIKNILGVQPALIGSGNTGNTGSTGGTSGGTSPSLVGQWYQNYTAETPASASNAASVQGYDAAKYSTTDWNVGSDQLVRTGVNEIIAQDGPMMERARAAADGESNKRGLVNSSMGVQASQNAVYDNAIAIASPDAKTRADSARFNAGEKNLAAFNNAQAENRAREFGAAAANAYGIADLGSKTQLQVAGIGAAASKYNTDVNSADTRYVSNARSADTRYTTDANSADTRYVSDARSSDSRYAADLGAETSRYGTDVGARTEIQRANIAADSAKYGVDVGASTSILQSQIAAASSKSVAEINRDSAWATTSLSTGTQLEVAKLSSGTQTLVATINADTNKYISAMDNNTRLQVQEFANANQLLLNTNTQATSAFNQAMAAISTIQNNAAMDAGTKTQAIRSIFASVNSQFNTLESISGLNIPDLLDFTGATDANGNPLYPIVDAPDNPGNPFNPGNGSVESSPGEGGGD